MAGMSALALAIWVVGAMVALYIARDPAHRAITALCRTLYRAFRISARAVLQANERLKRRNREVLLAQGREHAERVLEREFERVHASVARDLATYPALHRKLSEQLTRIDEDYAASADVPPAPPAWTTAVEAVAQIPARENPVVADVLEDIHQTLLGGQKRATADYRKSKARRHKLLQRMLPHWRKVRSTLDEVNRKISGLGERAKVIDSQIADYELLRAGDDKAVRMLASSSLTQFTISGVVVLIAILGGFINFNLIALPMSEMVGGGSYIGSLKTSDVAGLVIILIEISMGIFLMESLRITRLFPIIGSMDDKMRRRMIVATFALLFTLACVEASLAYMRDLLAADREALAAQLAGTAASQPEFRWIPAVGQMVMGFILPFALTFVAIPLESFIHSSRTVLGLSASALLQTLAFALRLSGNVSRSLGGGLANLYDLTVFLPLKLERLLRERHAAFPKKPQEAALPAPAAPLASKGG